MTKVSIIIPVYKAEKYIERCVESLMKQTMQEEVEFIFINDATPDNSMEVLCQTIEKFPNRKQQVKIVNNEKNMGILNTRKLGLEIASGEYVGSCDSDDWVEPEMFQKMYQATQNGLVDIVVVNYYMESNTTVEFIHHPSNTPQDALAESWKHNYIPYGLPFQLIRKSIMEYAIQQLYPTKQGEDTYMIRYIYFRAKSIVFLPYCYYHYDRTNESSITHNSDLRIVQWNAHKINIDKISSLLLGTKKGQQQYRKAMNYLKYSRKQQYRFIFKSIRDFYKIYSECYIDINSILNTPTNLRKRTFLIYNIYPLFWLYFRKSWNK